MDMKMRVKTKKYAESRLLELDDEELEPMSPTTEYFSSEVLTVYVICILETEIPIDIPSTLAFLNNDFINLHPRLSSTVVQNKKGENMWKKVSIDVQDHIKTLSFPEVLSAQDFNEHVDDYVSKIATSQLPSHRPLWEVHIIKCPKDHTAAGLAIFKIHHAVGDGASLMGGILSCVKRVDNPSLPITFPSKTPQTASKKEHNVVKMIMNTFMIVPEFVSTIIYSMYDFGAGVRMLFFEDTKTPIRSGTTNMTRPFSTRACSVVLPLNDVKDIKTLLGVTVNDVIVGIIFLATRLYIQEVDQGWNKNSRSTATILVNIRSTKGSSSIEEMRKAKTWGNRITCIEIPLPNLEDEEVANPIKFIHKAHKIIRRKRLGIYGPFLMSRLLDTLRTVFGVQTAARTSARRWKNSSFAITNLIGPTEKISIAAHPIKSFYFIPTGVDLSLVVSVMSYAEELKIGLVVENGFIDHQRLMTCVEDAFDRIFQAAQATSTTANYYTTVA